VAYSAPELLTRIRRPLADTASEAFQDAELLDYLNEGVRQVLARIAERRPEYWLRTSQANTHQADIVADQANYDLPADFWMPLLVVAVDSDGDKTVLDAISPERSMDSDAEGYLLRSSDIYLYPTPDEDVTDGLLIYYLSLPEEAFTASITAVGTGEDTSYFTIAGKHDWRWEAGDKVYVQGSTANDGEYTVSAATYSVDGDSTQVSVSETVSDGTVDGDLRSAAYLSVPLSDRFADAIVAWAVVKAKARKEERTPDFAAFYRSVDAATARMLARTNRPEEGLRVGWRNFI